jgi:aspartyl protease family protein
MGTFSVTVELGNLTSSKVLCTDALVDTGATHTLVSRSLLRGLGVEPIDRISFQGADERTVDYDVGQVRLKLDGRERIVLVVFGEDNASPLLGATTLEFFNFGVDPVQRRLVPVPGLLK